MDGIVPSVIIIARHGARLDAADKSWHLSSPTPYDPPLTYGGWMQARSLGLRIAHLLNARLDELESKEREEAQQDPFRTKDGASTSNGDGRPADNTGRKRKRKQKIIMHSSPFLRCVQTSVALSGGIASYKKPKEHESRGRALSDAKLGRSSPTRSPSPLSREVGIKPLTSAPTSNPVDSTPDARKDQNGEQEPDSLRKTTLRIDAFLGEWLSPEYFEDITPPPNSTFMVANAKAELLRRADRIDALQPQNATNGPGNFPGGWGKKVKAESPSRSSGATVSAEDRGPLSHLEDLEQALPRRDRAGTQASESKAATISAGGTDAGLYVPPVPSYAIAHIDPIPAGYPAHTRDACVIVDYQWDSMREPQEWGGGGENGEEWSAMHRRFRKGLSNMVNWYKSYGTETPNLSPTSKKPVPVRPQQPEEEEEAAEEEEEEELILILVTHGAGCNALIGALTNQPVLIDVGTASLTWARLRQTSPRHSPTSPRTHSTSTLWSPPKPPPPPSLLSSSPPPTPPSFSSRRRSSLDPRLAQSYEIRHLATTTHLTSGVDPSRLPTLDSPKPPPSIPTHVQLPEHAAYRRRFDGLSSSGLPGSSSAAALIGSTTPPTASSAAPSAPPFAALNLTNAAGAPVRAMSAALSTARKPSAPTRSWSSRSQSPAEPGGRDIPGRPGGLWNANRSPALSSTVVGDADSLYSNSPGRDMVLNFGDAGGSVRMVEVAGKGGGGRESPVVVIKEKGEVEGEDGEEEEDEEGMPERQSEEEERDEVVENFPGKPPGETQGLWGTGPSHMRLWGASQAPKLDRERAVKRRWTVNDPSG